jgi:hypothetical protein
MSRDSRTHGNRIECARLLRVGKSPVYRKLKEYRLTAFHQERGGQVFIICGMRIKAKPVTVEIRPCAESAQGHQKFDQIDRVRVAIRSPSLGGSTCKSAGD